MKNCRLLGAAAAAALLLLTSCLGENNSTASFSMVPGVVRFDLATAKILIDSNYGTIYAKEFEKYADNDCVLLDFSYDSQSQVSGEYLTVTPSGITEVPKGQTFRAMTDTSVLKTDEVPLLTSVEKSASLMLAYLNGYLFLPSGIYAPTDQKTNWELSYNPKLEAVEENGKRVYSLFMRASIRTKGEGKAANVLYTNAFEMRHYFDAVNSIEKGKNNKKYFVKIYYIKSINEKNPKEFTWAACEPLEFGVSEK